MIDADLAKDIEVAAIKPNAIANPESKKGFFDLHELAEYHSLSQMLDGC
ncbi:hypothetical protein OKA05_23565 [Luteolibacter arcticus]|uniref:Uncharacterized protein n=1 Tax=Luteolibacter arcticus TaxID=1581411 RepID=A0ABT3GPW0_9BACT|nr:hypothetical protein [Luteolibacter arcticus]MCW1925557.1 hypothetical protein [Luteolibacter arcticus]